MCWWPICCHKKGWPCLWGCAPMCRHAASHMDWRVEFSSGRTRTHACGSSWSRPVQSTTSTSSEGMRGATGRDGRDLAPPDRIW
eukprot:255959-Amphidinium_carterae.2